MHRSHVQDTGPWGPLMYTDPPSRVAVCKSYLLMKCNIATCIWSRNKGLVFISINTRSVMLFSFEDPPCHESCPHLVPPRYDVSETVNFTRHTVSRPATRPPPPRGKLVFQFTRWICVANQIRWISPCLPHFKANYFDLIVNN
jgi:hypothetical protein